MECNTNTNSFYLQIVHEQLYLKNYFQKTEERLRKIEEPLFSSSINM